MKLYKYIGPDRIDILQKQQIRFSQPYALNDPFETQPFYSDDVAVHPLRQLAELGKIIRQVQETGAIPEKEVADYEALRTRPQKNTLSWYVNTNFVSLSMAARHDNLLMWSHYAANHRGMVIELDSTHPFFTDHTRYLYPIPYSRERPAITLREFEKLIIQVAHRLKMKEKMVPSEMDALVQLFRKGADWSYEEEWRLLAVPEYAINYKEGDHQYTIEISPEKPINEGFSSSYLALYQMPPDCIKAIYGGARISRGLLRQLFLLVENNPGYHHIDLQVAELDKERYALNFRKVTEIDIMTVGELMYDQEVKSGKRSRHVPKWYRSSPLDRLENDRMSAVIHF